MRSLARSAVQAERSRQTAAQRALRETERKAKADAKQAAQNYLTSQVEETEALSREVRDREQAIETLLARALNAPPAIDLSTRIKPFNPAKFDESKWPSNRPYKEAFAPLPPSFLRKIL